MFVVYFNSHGGSTYRITFTDWIAPVDSFQAASHQAVTGEALGDEKYPNITLTFSQEANSFFLGRY